MTTERARLLDRRTLLRSLVGGLVLGTAAARPWASWAATIPTPEQWSDNPSGTASSLSMLGKVIIKDKNPQYTDPRRYGQHVTVASGVTTVVSELVWSYHVQNDFSPNTWSFRGKPREITRAIRVPYHVTDSARVVVEYVLIGFEEPGHSERPKPKIDGAMGGQDDRWKHFFSSGAFDPAITTWGSDMELLGWLVMYNANPLYEATVTGDYTLTNSPTGVKPNVAQVDNWAMKVAMQKRSAIWPFRDRPTRIDGSIRIPYRVYSDAAKEWSRVWLLVGYEGGGAI